MNQKRKLLLRSPLAILLLLWVAYLLLLGGLRRAGLDYGFKIGPQREDLNWMDFFLDASGGHVAQVFWKLDGRNPLSPWWYIVAEPLIRRSPYGLHVASMVINPFLAFCTYLLLDRLGRGRSKAFAFTVALVVMLWTFTSSYSHIQWNFYGAAGFTLLSIYCYCGYIDSKRARGGSMVIALLFYLVAIGTYTLQTGAVVAVFFLALMRSDAAWPERVKRCAFDCGAFVALFLLFSLIWSATTTLPQSVFFSPDLPLFVGQALQSLWLFVTAPTISQQWQDAVNQWSTGNLIAVFLASFIVIGAILFGVVRSLDPEHAQVPLGWVLVVLFALSLPTLLLEATSTIWVPGARSPMLQPLFQPLLWIGAVFAVSTMLRRYALPKWVPFAGSAAVAALVVVLALPHNQRLVQTTYHQLNLAKQLNILSADLPEGKTRYYVTRVTSKGRFDAVQPLLAERNLDVYGRTILGRKGVRLYILENESPACEPRINYADDKVTIGLAQIPSDQVVTLFYDGKLVKVPTKIWHEDLAETCMTWTRSRPIEQSLRVASPGG